MKTAISLPDELFERAEEFARRTGRSRSELFREALFEYLVRRDPQAITRVMDEALAEIHERQSEKQWRSTTSSEALERSEW